MKSAIRVGLACLLMNLAVASGEVLYTVTPIGPGTSGSGINSSGQVTGGFVAAEGSTDAFVYSNGVTTDLGTLPGTMYSFRSAINDSGQVTGVAGFSGALDDIYYAFLFGNGAMTELSPVPGAAGFGYGINDSGQITGVTISSAEAIVRDFLFSNGAITYLDNLSGSSASQGNAINRSGQITGSSSVSSNQSHAFLYSNGVVTDLGMLPGDVSSQGSGIDDLGQVAGYSFASSSARRAFIYSGGLITDPNSLNGFTLTDADGISDPGQIVANGTNVNGQAEAFILANDLGQAAGYSFASSSAQRAFIYGGDPITDPNSLLVKSLDGFTLTDADGINDPGQIGANGTNANGQAKAFILTQVPEPSTLALMAVGLGALLAMRRGIFRQVYPEIV